MYVENKGLIAIAFFIVKGMSGLPVLCKSMWLQEQDL
jgi:biotin transporter BioY